MSHSTIYPATTPAELWAGIRQEYRLIRDMVGFSDRMERILLAPIVHRYLQMVHLLPASQGHHHAYPGGLLRHGLEVANKGLELAEGLLFTSPDDPPSIRHMLTPRWSIAIVIAGFAHDLGKLEDVHIESNGEVFQPHTRILSAWIAEHAPNGYELTWRKDRHGDHEHRGLLYAEKLVTDAARDWMLEPGTGPYAGVLDYLSGTPDTPLEKVLTEADRYSVRVDLSRAVRPQQAGAVGGLAEVVKGWISEAKRTGPHPDVLVDASFVWIPWTSAVKGLGHRLVETAGTPRDMDSICGLLVQTGLLADPPAPFDAGGQVPTWRISVAGSNSPTNAIAIPWPRLGLSPSGPFMHIRPVESASDPRASQKSPAEGPSSGAAAAEDALPHKLAAPASTQQEEASPDSSVGTGGASAPSNAAYEWLESLGPIGHQLSHLVRQYSSRLLPDGLIQVREDRVWLRWPDIWRLGSPPEAMRALQELNWIEPAPENPLLDTRKVDDSTWLVLKEGPSAKLIPLLAPQFAAPAEDRELSDRLLEQVQELMEFHPEWREPDGSISLHGVRFMAQKLGKKVWTITACIHAIDEVKKHD